MPLKKRIQHIYEPNPLACGQAVLAMLSGDSVESVISLVGTERETKLSDMFAALDYYGIKYDKTRKQAFEVSDLPSVCILSLETPKCWHWSLYRDGIFYDPEYGVLSDFPPSARRYYFEIKESAMKVYLYTLGCKVNQYESQAVAEQLAASGYEIATKAADADIVIINSCTVTAESDRKTRQAVRRFKKAGSTVLLMGCMPSAIPETAEALPEADIVIGNTNHSVLPSVLEEFLRDKKRIVRVGKHKQGEAYCTPSITAFSEHTRAFMKIEDGCDRYCTYCLIPFARGPIRSRPLEDIKAEAKALAKNGFREIVLVGINLTSYGRGEAYDIADAVRAASVEGIERIRLGSLEPDHMSDELLRKLAAEPLFCPQFHLALQSGSDATLARMNRHYNTAFFADIVSRIRKSFANSSITTDVMVGFPDESEENFSESVRFIEKIGFARSHVFAYSKRSGTVSAGLPNQIPENEKSRRAKIMAEAAARAEKAFLDSQVGLTEAVLFEQKNGDYFEGYTKNYTRVKVKTNLDLGGKIKNVRLISAENDYCLGEII